MRRERRRKDSPPGQRFRREEQRVGNQEERDRPDVPLSLPMQVHHCQKAWTEDQIPNASYEPAIDAGQCLDQLIEEAAICQLACEQRTFAA
jgi:hypothetical protein